MEVAIGVVVALAILGFVLFLIARFAPETFAAIADAENSEIIRNYGLVLVGIIGLPLLIWRSRTAQQQADHQSNQVMQMERARDNDRYQTAVQMLGSGSEVQEIAAVETLQRLRTENPIDYEQAVVGLFASLISDTHDELVIKNPDSWPDPERRVSHRADTLIWEHLCVTGNPNLPIGGRSRAVIRNAVSGDDISIDVYKDELIFENCFLGNLFFVGDMYNYPVALRCHINFVYMDAGILTAHDPGILIGNCRVGELEAEGLDWKRVEELAFNCRNFAGRLIT